MLDAMELKFNQIRDLSGGTVFTTKQFTIQVFRDLLTATNQDFKRLMLAVSSNLYRCTTSTTRMNLTKLT
eukprot:15336372-Ditylum_brightwellii.AAC.1